jgi:hypothetical protein
MRITFTVDLYKNGARDRKRKGKQIVLDWMTRNLKDKAKEMYQYMNLLYWICVISVMSNRSNGS